MVVWTTNLIRQQTHLNNWIRLIIIYPRMWMERPSWRTYYLLLIENKVMVCTFWALCTQFTWISFIRLMVASIQIAEIGRELKANKKTTTCNTYDCMRYNDENPPNYTYFFHSRIFEFDAPAMRTNRENITLLMQR